MFTVLCNYTKDYQPLIDRTWFANKVPYCERHGYSHELSLITVENFHQIQVHKVEFIREILLRGPEDSWVWWTGADLMVTNFNVKLESIVDYNYHFIIGVDMNGMNADSFLLRNSEKGRNYINMICDILPNYNNWEGEQGIMKETYEQFKHDVVKLVPQRTFNSYNYTDYSGSRTYTPEVLANGNWEVGDFAIHWPAYSLEERIKRYDHYSQFVVK